MFISAQILNFCTGVNAGWWQRKRTEVLSQHKKGNTEVKLIKLLQKVLTTRENLYVFLETFSRKTLLLIVMEIMHETFFHLKK